MEDVFRPFRGATCDFEIAEIPLHQLKRVSIPFGESGEVLLLPREEIVQDPDPEAFREEDRCQVRSDEPRSAGHQIMHSRLRFLPGIRGATPRVSGSVPVLGSELDDLAAVLALEGVTGRNNFV